VQVHSIGVYDLGRSYLLYSPSSGNNCSVMLKTKDLGNATEMEAYIAIPSKGVLRYDVGKYKYYAGPVRVYAKNTCVTFGGVIDGFDVDSGLHGCN